MFRTVPLDGALLSFDRDTGVAVLAEGEETAHLVQRAPRVVQFGITNACNLSCGFCSRDSHASSEWTVETAFDYSVTFPHFLGEVVTAVAAACPSSSTTATRRS